MLIELPTNPQPGTIAIAGYPVTRTDAATLARRLYGALGAGDRLTVFFANTNFIVQCRAQLPRMQEAGVIIVNDGVGLDIAAVLLRGARFLQNLNGTDFTPYLFAHAARPLRVFLVGGSADVLRRAAAHARDQLGQVVVGTCDGYDGLRERHDVIDAINRSAADVVLVALGNPMQEAWILNHRPALDATIVMGVGALFDFWAGARARAPALLQAMRLEWLYRLCQEPRRLARRYTVDIARFLLHCHRYRGRR
ncbi:WecB/TagA/CpsF family glycosyltransferase [Massilia sp. PWRC2]|uniref:WecB/TagA/CpsF family glycosyltransferase n=1 Tax=Massilia sp. PWRC2 TaxID=2804626 RepID=UPI003CED189B